MNENLHITTIAEELGKGNSITFFTKGISMEPLLTERETHVTIAPLVKAKNKDILLYVRKNGALVLHRCIKQNDVFYYMRGDNTYGLEKISKEQAIGVVTHIYRKRKQFAVDDKGYRAYVRRRSMSYPFRFLGHQIKRLTGKIFGKKERK